MARSSPSAAHRLVDSILDRTERLLASYPLAGRHGRAEGTPEMVVRATRLIVVYRVNDRVEIVAVVHAARQWPDAFS